MLGRTKLEIILHKNQHTQRKLLNCEFWINGELSNIGYHFSIIRWFKNWFYQKMSIPKNVLLNWYSSMKKKMGKIRMISDMTNWLWKSNFGTFWQLAINPKLKIQQFPLSMLIFWAKIILILYTPFENTTTRTAIKVS